MAESRMMSTGTPMSSSALAIVSPVPSGRPSVTTTLNCRPCTTENVRLAASPLWKPAQENGLNATVPSSVSFPRLLKQSSKADSDTLSGTEPDVLVNFLDQQCCQLHCLWQA